MNAIEKLEMREEIDRLRAELGGYRDIVDDADGKPGASKEFADWCFDMSGEHMTNSELDIYHRIQNLELGNAKLRAELSKRDWVSVNERLPELGVTVIGLGAHETPWFIYLAKYKDEVRWWDRQDDSWMTGITHWMPLPGPPK